MPKKTVKGKDIGGTKISEHKMTDFLAKKKASKERLFEYLICTSVINVSFEHGRVILKKSTDKPESRMTSFEKMELTDEGVTKKDLEQLKAKTNLSYDQLAKVLSVTKATLINKKGASRFKPVLTEKIVGIAEVYSYGYEVFEDEGRFNQWIFHPNQALSGKAPYDLLHNSFGRDEVKNLIGRIDYGVYS